MMNGCYNRKPLNRWVLVQDGYKDYMKTIPKTYYIRDQMSKECQYQKLHKDPKCDGCNWKKNLQSNKG